MIFRLSSFASRPFTILALLNQLGKWRRNTSASTPQRPTRRYPSMHQCSLGGPIQSTQSCHQTLGYERDVLSNLRAARRGAQGYQLAWTGILICPRSNLPTRILRVCSYVLSSHSPRTSEESCALHNATKPSRFAAGYKLSQPEDRQNCTCRGRTRLPRVYWGDVAKPRRSALREP